MSCIPPHRSLAPIRPSIVHRTMKKKKQKTCLCCIVPMDHRYPWIWRISMEVGTSSCSRHTHLMGKIPPIWGTNPCISHHTHGYVEYPMRLASFATYLCYHSTCYLSGFPACYYPHCRSWWPARYGMVWGIGVWSIPWYGMGFSVGCPHEMVYSWDVSWDVSHGIPFHDD